MLGSPTALADPEIEEKLFKAAKVHHGLYVPSGALWGGEDIRKMAERGTLKGVTVTMKKHPSSFKLNGELAQTNSKVLIIYFFDGGRSLSRYKQSFFI